MLTSTNQDFNLYRAALKSALDVTAAYLGSAERVRNHQLRTIKEALTERTETAKRLESANNFDELLAIQIGLGQAEWERIIRYWAGWFEAASENHIEAMKQTQAGAAKLGESVRQAMQAADGSEPAIVAALRAAMQPGATAPADVRREGTQTAVAGPTAEAGIRPADGHGVSRTG